MKSYSRLSFLHQWAEGNYSVDHSLFAFLLPPTEARATATVAETVPRLPYLHICIIKTFVKLWRNIVSDVTMSTLQHLKTKTLWLNKSHGTQHLCPLSQHLSLLLWKQLLFSRPWQRDRLHALPGGSLCLQQSMHWPLPLHHSAGLKRSDYHNLWLSDSIWIQWRIYAEQRLDKCSFHRGKMIRLDANSFLAHAHLRTVKNASAPREAFVSVRIDRL